MDKFLNLNKNQQIKKDIPSFETIIPPSKQMKIIDNSTIPWVEKYRPDSLNEISHHMRVVDTLKNSILQRKLQHLLFYGPPGTGKTSTILALAKEFFGKNYKERILELNASDERGINVIRDKVKLFSQSKIQKFEDSLIDLQIVILDEADMMTIDAQSALRRIIEEFSSTTRFCIICNYLNKIIDPISSRCSKFMFSPLPREIQFSRIRYILDKEGIVSNLDSIIYLVIDISEGDLRKSINQIQSISSIVAIKNDISIEELNDFLGIINQSEVDKIMNSLMEVSKPMNNLDLINLGIDFLYEGYDLVQLIKSINETIIKLYDNLQIQYGEKCIKELLGVLMDSEVNCLEGSDPEMEIKYLFANLNSLFKANKKKISSRIDID